MVVLDTSVIIDHLRQQQARQTHLMKIAQKVAKENLAISVVSLQELYEGRSTKDKDKEQHLLLTISPLKILPYNYEIAQSAGEIARDLSRSIEFAAAAIAATTIFNGAVLFTLNKRHFKGIKGLTFYGV